MQKVGKYQVIRQIGSGATSSVFLAQDSFAKRDVAVKVIFPEALKDKDRGKIYKKLFLTEASLAGKLKHPHIVEIYDAAVEDDCGYIVMEHVPGGTLEQYCEVDRLLPLASVVEIIYKCCKALEYAQRQGIIHRDIKPANILLAGETDIKISDFGAALVSQTQQTTQVTAVGSPAYMSPQQIREQTLNHQTDIYSLGVVMFRLLTGRLPFTGSNNYSMIYQILNTEAPPPSQLRPDLPRALDAIIAKALAKDPARRYPSWEEFGRDLVEGYEHIRSAPEDISDTEKFNSLRGLPFFRDFSDVELWEVVRVTEWRRHGKDDTLILEGDVGTSFYILASGKVSITKDGKLLNALEAGDCFGEMAYLAKREFRRTASVSAMTDIVVIELGADRLDTASENCRHKFNGAFLQILVDRLALANTRLSQLLTERKVTIY